MDKKPIEILADSCGLSVSRVQQYPYKNEIKVPFDLALEAMKIAMKQAWIEGMNNAHRPVDNCVDFDEYINKLKEQRNG